MVEGSTVKSDNQKDEDKAKEHLYQPPNPGPIIQELEEILKKQKVVEFDRTHLTPLVYAWHEEQFKKEPPGDDTFISDVFIIQSGQLGMKTNKVDFLVKEIESEIKEFRNFYQPFNFNYDIKLEIRKIPQPQNYKEPELDLNGVLFEWIGLNKWGQIGQEIYTFMTIEQVQRVNLISLYGLLIDATNTSYVSVFYDSFDIMKKIFDEQNNSRSDLDNFVSQQLDMLQLPLLCGHNRKAAKMWSLRFTILSTLSAVIEYIRKRVKVFQDDDYIHPTQVSRDTQYGESKFTAGKSNESKEEMKIRRIMELQAVLRKEYAFCDKVNKCKSGDRNYYMWLYRKRITTEIVKPLIKCQEHFDEALLKEEYNRVRESAKTDPSAQHYMQVFI